VLYLLEALIAAYMGYVIYRLFKQGFAMNCIGASIFLADVLAATVVYYPAQWLSRAVFSNLFSQAMMPVLPAIGVYYAADILLSRRLKREDSPVALAVKKRLAMPRWADRTCCGGMALLLCVAAFVLATLMVMVISVDDGWRDTLLNRTLLLRAFVPEPSGTDELQSDGKLASASSDDAMTAQARIQRGIQNAWKKARGAVADSTGLSAVQVRLEALKEILNLSPEESAWLGEKNLSLKKLQNHPRLLAVIENERLLNLVKNVGQGDIGAVYALGDEPDIKALEDADFLQAIHDVDLLELRAQVRDYRKRRACFYPVKWDVSGIQSTLHLDDQLGRKDGWRAMPGGVTALNWNPSTHIGLARTGFFFKDAPKEKMQLAFRTSGRVSLLINDQSVKLKPVDDEQTFLVAFKTGKTDVVLMVEFVGVTGPHTCSAQAFVVKE
jgi:hypothetical protein